MKNNFEVIFCIVNEGFSELVMDCAREQGATGGTVMHANGTANVQAEALFGVSVQPEKEIVMIIVDGKIKDAVLRALYNSVGLKTAGQGIAFSLPISSVVGLVDDNDLATKKPKQVQSANEQPTVAQTDAIKQ